MSRETIHTGGMYKFEYSDEDNERIRNSDTPSTKNFKKAYNEWLEKKRLEKKQKKLLREKQKKIMIYSIIGLLVILVLFLLFKKFIH